MNFVNIGDWAVTILFLIIISIWAQYFVKKNEKDLLIKKYFRKGLYLKIFGSIAFACYHAYVYGGGDTFGYFMTGKTLTNQFFTSPGEYFELTFLPISGHEALANRVNWLWPDGIMWLSEANYFSARVAGFIQFFTFQTYIPTGIVFSLISYWGIWKCFRFFNRFFPNSEKIMAISFLFFPTLVFWGSGLSKDSLTLGAVCGLVVCAFQIFIFREKIFKNLLGFLMTMGVLFIVKPYVPVAFLIPLALSIGFSFLGQIKSSVAKFALFPIVVICMLGFTYFLNSYVEDHFMEGGVDAVTERIVNQNQNLQDAGSAFDLGIRPQDINGLGDMAPFLPKAVIATWYRPWLWEAKNPAMLLAALEGLFLIIITIVICVRGYFIKTIFTLISNSVLFSLFFYCIIFSGLIGLSTSNFGTLVRYKIPMLPFFVMVLLMTGKILKDKKQQRKTKEIIKIKSQVPAAVEVV